MNPSLYSIVFYALLSFFVFPFFGNAIQTLDCDCGKILEEKKCDNPDCIKACNLQHVFNEAGEFIANKCLEKMIEDEDFVKEKNFDIKGETVTVLEKVIKNVKNIREENGEILEEYCPDCRLHGKTRAKLVANQKVKACNKYIHTEGYREWREKWNEVKHQCSRYYRSKKGRGGSTVRLDRKTKKLCDLKSKYETCCPKEYLFDEKGQLIVYKHKPYSDNVGLEEDQTCEAEEVNELSGKIDDYVRGVMRGNRTEFSEKIYDKCPDPCSFKAVYVTEIDGTTCSGDLDLKVACTHQAKRSIYPYYNIEINYTEVPKCQ